MAFLPQPHFTDRRIKYTAVSITNERVLNMRNELTTENTSGKAMTGATTGALIGARFGPQGIAIGAIAGGVIGFLLDD